MSSLKDKFGMAIESAKAIATNAIHGEEIMEEPATVELRMKICNDCPKLTKMAAMKLCSVCGCSVVAKTKFRGVTCPEGKWQKNLKNIQINMV